MDGLTESQEQCLNTIAQFITESGHAPTRRELAERLSQKSINGVNQKLRQLEKKGYIRLYPARKQRNIFILRIPQRQMDLFEQSN